MPQTATETLALHRGDPYALMQLLALPDALLNGHFQLLSGLHTDQFLAFSRVAREPGALDLIAGWLAPSLAPYDPSAVIAPSTAGVGLGWALAQRLGVAMHLASLNDAGRADGVIGEPDLSGQRLVLVNDIVTTGTGLAALADVVRRADGEVVAAAWFVSRAPVDVAGMIGAPGVSIADIEMSAWPASECPACGSSDPTPAIDLN